ncbi:endosome-associated ubiquitin isopeptidase [Niveomyces insectorum RCEF 264]|uniref:Endosome-associated ubiquitin isopeptidase n=1 Tax=Niveomyces insectorum RCEF 264 TaxID=1081102 RepID=A0A167XST0_9HYPO|nr:endosome-associated ubiquitin isopeptidase [Niveomyces insectorum RCEF 264]
MAGFNGARGPGQLSFAPLEPSELAKEASVIQWNPHIQLKYYVGALDAVYREGRNYLRERNFAMAYKLLFRFSILYLEKVTTLPEARTPEGRKLLKLSRERINGVLVELERIKPVLVEAREKWTAEHAQQAARAGGSARDDAVAGFAPRDAALTWNAKAQAKILDVSDHQDLAVELAAKELRRRDAAKKATRQAGVSEEEERARRTAGVWENWDDQTSSVYASTGEVELRHQMEQARSRLDRRGEQWAGGQEEKDDDDGRPAPVPVAYHYPSISKLSQPQHSPSHSSHQANDYKPLAGPPPRRPPKETPGTAAPTAARFDVASPPPVPPRGQPWMGSLGDLSLLQSSPERTPPPLPPPVSSLPPMLPPKTKLAEAMPPSKEEQYTFRPAAYLEDGKPIRPIFLPEALRRDFVRLAESNTRRGIETCGILCGTNINNALFITCLLIPQQHGTPDTCETTNEAATFDFFEKEDLLQFGWIHTHPTQTCFMSSRDLHTQAGYQIMMDESIAIVCAPKHEPSWGIFRLTKPPGLQHLLNCDKTDTFHQHSLPADALYTDAKNPPGHVFVSSRMNYRIFDLRET